MSCKPTAAYFDPSIKTQGRFAQHRLSIQPLPYMHFTMKSTMGLILRPFDCAQGRQAQHKYFDFAQHSTGSANGCFIIDFILFITFKYGFP
jgi:hypothetical protein